MAKTSLICLISNSPPRDPAIRRNLQGVNANICVPDVCIANSVSEARARNSRAAEAQPTAAAKERYWPRPNPNVGNRLDPSDLCRDSKAETRN